MHGFSHLRTQPSLSAQALTFTPLQATRYSVRLRDNKALSVAVLFALHLQVQREEVAGRSDVLGEPQPLRRCVCQRARAPSSLVADTVAGSRADPQYKTRTNHVQLAALCDKATHRVPYESSAESPAHSPAPRAPPGPKTETGPTTAGDP